MNERNISQHSTNVFSKKPLKGKTLGLHSSTDHIKKMKTIETSHDESDEDVSDQNDFILMMHIYACY